MGGRGTLSLAVLCAAIAGCGGGAPAPRSPAAKASATPTPSPLTFGTHRYISPCSVLPIGAAQRIYGAMKPLGYVRQEYYDRSLTPAEFKQKTDNASRSVRTVCRYNRGDAHRTSVQVTVEQYRSDKAARSEWASIAYLGTGKESRKLAKRDFSGPSWDFNWIAKLARENERDMGGKRVKGIDDVLFVRGRADFIGFRHNALVRVSYLPLSRSGRRSTASGASTACPIWTPAAC